MEPQNVPSPTSRQPLHLRAGATAAVFAWNGDRWTHRVAFAGSDASTEWLGIDGPVPAADDPRWPASPVLVELSGVRVSPGEAADGLAIVGVGLAGRSHFSASISSDPRDADTIRFEIACRLHERPGPLGSTYRQGARLFRLTPLDPSTVLPRTVVWSYSIGPLGIVSVEGATVSTGPA